MLDKLSTALQFVKDDCEENALTLRMSAGKTVAIVLIRNDKAKQPSRRRRRARCEWWKITMGAKMITGRTFSSFFFWQELFPVIKPDIQ